ncbi:uncharacterized protein LOC127718685 [Mytilus californianus]|uniref:uncharacterized protein LOC127718685 n=1 Tax=Mytilus californianus TaxID=6549 RepID=UPI0022457F92|nr:uncharacterized protein LOC127718685 [Mytilus californianus]
MAKTLASILLLFVCFGAASAGPHCTFPCFRFDVGTWVSDTTTLAFSCSNTSIVTVNGMEERSCYARRGPFLVTRSGNTYRCVKYVAYNSKARISLAYAPQAKTFLTEPSICDVCSGSFSPFIFRGRGQNYGSAKQMISAPLVCNRPPLCPITDDINDIPCVDFEPIIDDGFMCSSCRNR